MHLLVFLKILYVCSVHGTWKLQNWCSSLFVETDLESTAFESLMQRYCLFTVCSLYQMQETSYRYFMNKILSKTLGYKENSSSTVTCKLEKVWTTDSKSEFSFSPTYMVFEMWLGVCLFSYENWIQNFNLFTLHSRDFYNWLLTGQKMLAHWWENARSCNRKCLLIY